MTVLGYIGLYLLIGSVLVVPSFVAMKQEGEDLDDRQVFKCIALWPVLIGDAIADLIDEIKSSKNK